MYYEEKAKSIKILQANSIRITKISLSTKLMLSSKVETIISNKGKDVVRGSKKPERWFEKLKISNVNAMQAS